ncbi:hypothetical protein [Phenylobacterium sp.]|uniref:hypothetical protein n=1 Tax=Phenylobacterium sp. TaxID=1871053 RepID=UPI0026009292|nr:hypothetical protein [Phenylobacterium sp.]
MKPIDIAKALGVGLAVLVLNLLATTAIITAYAVLVAPGHPPAFYQAAAPRIGAWSGPAGGVLLLFAASWWLGRRRRERNALLFAAAVGVAYGLVDLGSGAAMAGAAAMANVTFAVSMLLALLAALAGGLLASRKGRGAA